MNPSPSSRWTGWTAARPCTPTAPSATFRAGSWRSATWTTRSTSTATVATARAPAAALLPKHWPSRWTTRTARSRRSSTARTFTSGRAHTVYQYFSGLASRTGFFSTPLRRRLGQRDRPRLPPVTGAPARRTSELPFRLFSPATGTVTDSVTLRAPNLGNKDRLSFNRIVRETRGGTLIVFADPIWPKLETLVLTFSGLQRHPSPAVSRVPGDAPGRGDRTLGLGGAVLEGSGDDADRPGGPGCPRQLLGQPGVRGGVGPDLVPT